MTGSIDFGALMRTMGEQLEIIPVGDYDVVVKTATAGTTKAGDKPMIKVKYSIETGPQAGRPVYHNLTITQDNQQSLMIFFQQMKALGLDSTFFTSGPSLEQVAQNLVGKRARVNIQHREYQGNPQIDVKRVNPPVGGQGAAPGPVGLGAAPVAGFAPAPVAPPTPASAPVAAPAPVATPAPVAQAPLAPPANEAPTPPPPAPVAPAPEQVEAPAATPVAPPEQPVAPAPAPAAPAPVQDVAPAAPAVAPAAPVAEAPAETQAPAPAAAAPLPAAAATPPPQAPF